MPNCIQLKTVSLKNHPVCNERWLQDAIAEDPSVIGLGDVILKDRERIQPGAGRLDLLLQDADGSGRYEVELQLGATDPSHIIRTIEYWDIERRRHPKYEHTAVIIAEDITSRFLNVISLFNGFIPIIAFQVTAIETSEGVGLHFTKVLDASLLEYDDEDEPSDPADRNYWETKRGKPQTVNMADTVLNIAKERLPGIELNYNRHYIGFWYEGRACNFASCRPRKSCMLLYIKLPKTDEIDELLEANELDLLDYSSRSGEYRIRLSGTDIEKNKDLLTGLLTQALERRVNM